MVGRSWKKRRNSTYDTRYESPGANVIVFSSAMIRSISGGHVLAETFIVGPLLVLPVASITGHYATSARPEPLAACTSREAACSTCRAGYPQITRCPGW